MNLTLPDFFKSKLDANASLNSCVLETITEFSAWMDDSKLPFFEDYTDHGVSHLVGVLETMQGLIPGVAKTSSKAAACEDLITSADVALLVLATLLHDSAMHLSKDGFDQLIRGTDSESCLLPLIDSKPWPEMWREFMFQASRWDDNKRSDVFGDDLVSSGHINIEDPFAKYYNLGEGDKRLIGEFIRQNHPRMAHEFAIAGVPGGNGKRIRLPARLGNDYADLAGLIARSHGMEIRPCIDYMKDKDYTVRVHREVHVPYLMCLIRVADYLQIQASRSSTATFRYKHIPSKQSRLEHRVHESIDFINSLHDDPESIEVRASPKAVDEFLRLQQWLGGIQTELDQSWAVLGEVYGLLNEMHRLGLVLRRIRSNLDDIEKFRSKVSFVPARIEFDAARAELLKLLIGPLYGDESPQFGVRELLQNSLDAVRERTKLKGPISDACPGASDDDTDILISISEPRADGSAEFIISDRGIGMTEDMIKNYFLRAGASYRRSSSWQEQFETGLIRGAGSTIPRSGRFGVGALAAFLLGPEIDVTTRHVDSAEGYRFTTKLTQAPIELQRMPDLPVGTTIRVCVTEKCAEALRKSTATTNVPAFLDWYALAWPKVVRCFGLNMISGSCLPCDQDACPENWRELPDVSDYRVFWKLGVGGLPAMACNGLWVTNKTRWREFKSDAFRHPFLSIQMPKIAIVDPDAKYPLRLDRSSVSFDRYPFENALLKDIILDWFAYLIAHAPTRRIHDWKALPLHHPAWGGRSNQVLSGKLGLIPLDTTILGMNSISSVAYLGRSDFPETLELNHDVCVLVRPSKLDADFISHQLVLSPYYSTDTTRIFDPTATLGVRIVASKNFVKKFTHTEKAELRVDAAADDDGDGDDDDRIIMKALGAMADDRLEYFDEAQCGRRAVIATEGCPPPLYDSSALAASGNQPPVLIFEHFIETNAAEAAAGSLISTLWGEYIGHPCIPYNEEERRTKLASAYEKLRSRIDYYTQRPVRLAKFAGQDKIDEAESINEDDPAVMEEP